MSSFFFSKKFQHICVSLDVNFNESLTNDVVSFEQLGPDVPKREALFPSRASQMSFMCFRTGYTEVQKKILILNVNNCF